ncbi:MAG: hypothetical protein KOO69_01055 [Victivallales bacterium]|nr:hypothetical protein [Victivallales bacterium]
MSKFFIALLTVFCFSAVAQQGAKHSMTQEVLLAKMEKAADPKDIAKTWTTMKIKLEMSVPMQQLTISGSAIYKFPDKSKSIALIPGMPTVTQVFNGKQAWKETVGLGMQEKTGIQLAFARFECKKINPAMKLSEVYEKITLDPYLYKKGNFTCYKLICSLPAELNVAPSQMFIDNKNFLVRYSVENQLTEMGAVPVTIELLNYKIIKGVKAPMLMNMNMMGVKMVSKILSIKVNEKIADSEFKFPGK